MKTTVVTAGQLAAAGRWDAPYHCLVAEHQPLFDELTARFTYEELAALAKSLPFDQRAADAVYPVVRGNTRADLCARLDRHFTGRRHVRDVAAYVAAAAHDAAAVIWGQRLELRRQELALVTTLADLTTLAKAQAAPLLLAALTRELKEP